MLTASVLLGLLMVIVKVVCGLRAVHSKYAPDVAMVSHHLLYSRIFFLYC